MTTCRPLYPLVLGCLLAACAPGRGLYSDGFARKEAVHAAAESPPPLDLHALARAVHAQVDRARAGQGLPPLSWSDPLASLARAHSSDMAAHGYFSHTNRRTEDPTARAARAGLECRKQVGNRIYTGVGENLFLTAPYASYRVVRGPNGPRRTFQWKSQTDLAREIVAGWMNSAGHRANLLSRLYESHGIGIVRAGDGMLYITENFC